MSLLLLFGPSAASVDVTPGSVAVTAPALTPSIVAPTVPATPGSVTVTAPPLTPSRGVPITELLWVHDLLDRQTMTIDRLLAFELDDRLQDSEVLRFTVTADDPKAAYILIDGLVRYRDRYWRITRRDPSRDGTRVVIDVEAEARWMELATTKRVGSFVLNGVTAEGGLWLILQGTGWDALASFPTGPDYSIDATDQTVLGLVRQWCTITGLEVAWDTKNRTATLVEQVGSTRDFGFRYAWNLTGIVRHETPPLVTRLYAYGRSDLTIEGPNPTGEQFIEDYSWYTGQGLTLPEAQARFRRDDVWQDDTFIDDVSLYAAAVARLTALAQPTVAYEAKVVDLARAAGLPPAFVDFAVGDVVPVNDSTLGIGLRTRVVRIVRRPLVPNGDEIELSYLQGRVDSSAASRGGFESEQWILFVKNSAADRIIDANLALLGDIGLQFVAGGQAIHHFDAVGTATGSGMLRVTFYDEIGNAVVGPVVDVPFSAGPVHVGSAFSLDDLSGRYLFSVRAQVVSGSGSVAFLTGASRYSILAKGAVGVTVPPDETSVTYSYIDSTGPVLLHTAATAQDFDVPIGVTSVVVDCYGAQGGGSGTTAGGKGNRLRARVPVTSGETLKVFVGGQAYGGVGMSFSTPAGVGGGGCGGSATTSGAGGGGAADVRRAPYGLADRLVVAGGGGGGSYNTHLGGVGGYPTGSAGDGGAGGGTQSAGGAGSAALFGGTAGTNGSLGQGGDGGGGGATLGGGGGGGGLYGGGGGGNNNGSGGGGSGGAPGAGVTEVLAENGVRGGHGQVTISWDTPV